MAEHILWYEDDIIEHEKLEDKADEILQRLQKETSVTPERPYKPIETENKDNKGFSDEWNDIVGKIHKHKDEVEHRFIESFRTCKSDIMKEIKANLSDDPHERFLMDLDVKRSMLGFLYDNGGNKASISELELKTVESYENYYNFLFNEDERLFTALEYYNLDTGEAKALIENEVNKWYKKPPTSVTVPYSKPTDAITYLTERDISIINPISGEAVTTKGGVTFKIKNYKAGKAGVSISKLVIKTLSIFQRDNDFHKGTTTARDLIVSIPIKEYARELGRDIDENPTNTPEEAGKEKKRAKAQLDNTRRELQNTARDLYDYSLEWEEKTFENGKEATKSMGARRFISGWEYKRGRLDLTLDPVIADTLVAKGIFNKYSNSLYSIPEKRHNAFYIQKKLEEHYNLDQNKIKGTNDIISVKALLAVTDLASYEEVQAKDRGHWEKRIKDPLEDNLNYLCDEGLLLDYEYVHAKKIPLTDEEAENITSYQEYEALYIRFEPALKVDRSAQIERKKEEIKKAKARKKRARKKKSTSTSKKSTKKASTEAEGQ